MRAEAASHHASWEQGEGAALVGIRRLAFARAPTAAALGADHPAGRNENGDLTGRPPSDDVGCGGRWLRPADAYISPEFAPTSRVTLVENLEGGNSSMKRLPWVGMTERELPYRSRKASCIARVPASPNSLAAMLELT